MWGWKVILILWRDPKMGLFPVSFSPTLSLNDRPYLWMIGLEFSLQGTWLSFSVAQDDFTRNFAPFYTSSSLVLCFHGWTSQVTPACCNVFLRCFVLYCYFFLSKKDYWGSRCFIKCLWNLAWPRAHSRYFINIVDLNQRSSNSDLLEHVDLNHSSVCLPFMFLN